MQLTEKLEIFMKRNRNSNLMLHNWLNQTAGITKGFFTRSAGSPASCALCVLLARCWYPRFCATKPQELFPASETNLVKLIRMKIESFTFQEQLFYFEHAC